ncbi:capsular biosynthesis protein [Streptococcus sp. X16XC17]|uniref:glycosyltransferase family 52 n=1 Tax=unclassified Streptococcus TaxID=2608887 RepID=UPI00066FEA96|nr:MULTISPECIES: glycosyltransferase family 52 [unclassified Streptococcus]TCD46267.1 capsular biosynthesis protein [Streptococcus sp. X16XC17]
MENTVENVYICHTVYHLLVTLCKLDLSQKNKLILFDKILQRDELTQKIQQIGFEVHGYSESDLCFCDFKNSKAIKLFLFNDWTNVGAFFRKNKIEYHLIEDGYNYFSMNVYKKKTKFLIRAYYKLFKKDERPLGYSRFCKSIEVNSLAVIPRDSRWKKFVSVSRTELFEKIPSKNRQLIFTLFHVEKFHIKSQSVLVLTQPLAADRWYKTVTENFQTLNEQFDYYQKIIEKYRTLGYTVYLKVHPRDKVDYSSLDVILLPQNIPMELLDMVCDQKFSIGITHSSTALDFLNCVEERITLFDLKGMK